MQTTDTQPAVTLDNCDREPIHIPGHIQDHGALLAFNADGRCSAASSNAQAFLGCALPQLGERCGPQHFGGNHVIAQALAGSAESGEAPQYQVAQIGDATFDVIVHRSGPLVLAEFERRNGAGDDPGAFAFQAHRSMDRLRRQRSVQELLEVAVQEVRALTGFDRVMAYRFRHDASGDVVAEACRDDLEPYINRRYPAGDIPAQARRLYVINTLRLIADVRSQPVPVASVDATPVDMSHSVLRSVSPVHIEYLTNMGVGASMSVSIVIGGQLWGMLACHHMAPRRVAYSQRMACDVLAQVLAANVQSLLAADHGQRMARTASLRSLLIEQMLHAEDAMAAIMPMASQLEAAFDAGAVVFSEGQQLALHGDVPKPVARSLVDWLNTQVPQLDGGLLAVASLASLPAPLAVALGSWCGLLALRIDEVTGGWLVFLRKEQVETIAWGGRPEKVYVTGPLGPRLTPRGSFDVWREIVRGTAVPWSTADWDMARQLRDELARASGARHAEMGRARNQMLAVLGHDLRNPLQTITMAAHVLERGADGVKLGRRIQNSSTRMERLISQVLDMTRLQSGLGLGVHLQPVDLARVVDEVIEDTLLAHPDCRIQRVLPPSLVIQGDADRLSQLLGNLIGNARHHGSLDDPILVSLSHDATGVVLAISNRSEPIPAETVAQLFAPFKRESLDNKRNQGGMGLGLYIAREIARGHGGTLEYRYEAGRVVFVLAIPAVPATAAP
jgi:light-regulated signal transduction histidine kinase (bacteriophytochrome)